MIHTIFFDIGGTLVTSKSTLTYFADRLNPDGQLGMFDFLVETFMSYYENEKLETFYTVKEILAISLKKASEKFDVPDLSSETEKYYRKNHLETGKLYDDILPVLKKLKEKGITLILASDADADVLVEQLEKLGILHFFDGRIISSDVRAYKPSEKVVLAAKKYCNKPLSGILFVGDNKVDVKMAKKLGVKSVLIHRDGRFKTDADYQIASLNELLNII